MSAPAGTPHPNPFLERIILFLMPYFLPVAPDAAIARAEIMETLASYGGTSRSEVINTARIIAFSFAALDTLAEAKDPDLSPSLRLRYKGCANNLNRACQQNELMLVERLTSVASQAPRVAAEPVNDVADAEVEGAIRHARAEIETYRNRLAAGRSPTLPAGTLPDAGPDEYKRQWGRAMIGILGEMGMPVQPAA